MTYSILDNLKERNTSEMRRLQAGGKKVSVKEGLTNSVEMYSEADGYTGLRLASIEIKYNLKYWRNNTAYSEEAEAAYEAARARMVSEIYGEVLADINKAVINIEVGLEDKAVEILREMYRKLS